MSEPLTPTELEEFKERANRIPWEHCIFTGHEMKRVLDERDALEREYHLTRATSREGLSDQENIAHPTTVEKIHFMRAERDTLRAQLEAANRDLDKRHAEYRNLSDANDDLDTENAALRARCEQLERAIEYAQHRWDCNMLSDGSGCDCGLNTARTAH